MNHEALANLTVAVRNIIITLIIIVLIMVGWSERQGIGLALARAMNRMQSAEIAGVKLSFGQSAINLNQDLSNSLIKNPARESQIDKAMRSLSAIEIERLLHRPDYGREDLSYKDMHCEYANAKSRVKQFLAADAALHEKGLVDIIERPAPGLIPGNGAPSDNRSSDPHRCYQMALTSLGADVKSLIITEISRAFGVSSYSGADILEKPDEKQNEMSAETSRETQKAHPEKP